MRKSLGIGLAGLGTVGAEVARHLLANKEALSAKAGIELNLVGVCARHAGKDRGVDVSGLPWSPTPQALAVQANVDLFVELVGGEDGPAYEGVTQALELGKGVVSANKAMLAKHWAPLQALCKSHKAHLKFEAAVAGGVPVIKVLDSALAANRITGIEGILNGTCNYILSQMAVAGLPFDEVLAKAQALGYAEAEPSLDIDGWDAAHKLVILAKMVFDPAVDLGQVDVKGIRDISLSDVQAASAQGKVIRLVASAKPNGAGGVDMRVAPVTLDAGHALAHVSGAMNAVCIEGDPVQTCTLIGPGAGAGPTASAVLADIIDVARRMRA